MLSHLEWLLLYKKCVIHFCVVWFDVLFCKHISCLLCFFSTLQMSMYPHNGFTNGACQSTQNLSSTSWAIYDPHGELINLQGICLGQTTNNIAEYSTIIELLSEAIPLDIWDLVVNLDSQLIILQLNGKYSVRKPQIL